MNSTPIPTDFKPCQTDDFIGPARPIAQALQRLVDRDLPTGRASAHMLVGPPGVGKSSICEFLVARVTGIPAKEQRHHYGLKFFNGKNVNADTIRDLAFDLNSRPMFGEWRVIWIDEVDQLTRDAQVLMLSLLDDLPSHTLVLTTSNVTFTEGDKEKRFQSRFQVWQVAGPTPEELAGFLSARWGVAPVVAQSIAVLADGDVRAALRDADTAALVALAA